MTEARMLAKALNFALAELREICETEYMNSFDHVMRHYPDDVRRFIEVDTSPVYWDNNDYDPDYVARIVGAKH